MSTFARRFAELIPAPHGGQIFLHEMLIDERGGGPLTTAAFSLMMLTTTRGKQYSLPELAQLLANAGFVDVRATPSYGYYSIVSASKP